MVVVKARKGRDMKEERKVKFGVITINWEILNIYLAIRARMHAIYLNEEVLRVPALEQWQNYLCMTLLTYLPTALLSKFHRALRACLAAYKAYKLICL